MPDFEITHETTVNAPPAAVHALVNDFRNWTQWSPWEQKDHGLQRTLTGADSGAGSEYAWTGNKEVGTGKMTITASTPERIEIDLEFIEPVKQSNKTIFAFTPEGEIGKTMILSSKRKQLAQGARYLLTREGPVATAGYDLMAHIKSRPEADRPDIQVVGIPFALDMSSGLDVADYPGVYLLGYQIRPRTQSSIHITASRPDVPPQIRANYLEDGEDRRVTGTIVGHLRSVLEQEPLASEIESEEFPGEDVNTPEQVVEFAHSPGMTIYHAVGSAAMGPNDDDVVAPDLRVRGVDGLRVADISILPHQVAGNTAAQAMAIGWLAADVIRSS